RLHFSSFTSEKVPVHAFVSRPIPGNLENVSKNDTGVKEAVLTGTYSFNNKSNDAFLFKASAVDDAKRQIVKGIRYILEVEISRTMCRKRGNTDDLNNCSFQTDSLLRQSEAAQQHQQLKDSSHHDTSSSMIEMHSLLYFSADLQRHRSGASPCNSCFIMIHHSTQL
uniref:Cystatin-F-like n=1 Tax=Sinocyclocheilus anshuiensis TaxID=1608454 RepID=A0A671PLK2_9TELE